MCACFCSMAAELVRLADDSHSSASSGAPPTILGSGFSAAAPGADAAAAAHVPGVSAPIRVPSSGASAGGAGAGGAPVESMQVCCWPGFGTHLNMPELHVRCFCWAVCFGHGGGVGYLCQSNDAPASTRTSSEWYVIRAGAAGGPAAAAVGGGCAGAVAAQGRGRGGPVPARAPARAGAAGPGASPVPYGYSVSVLGDKRRHT